MRGNVATKIRKAIFISYNKKHFVKSIVAVRAVRNFDKV